MSSEHSVDSRSSSVDRYSNKTQSLPAHLVSSDLDLKESNLRVNITKTSSIEGDSGHYSSPPRSKRIPKEPLQPSSLAKSLRESMNYDGRNDGDPISSYEERNAMVSIECIPFTDDPLVVKASPSSS